MPADIKQKRLLMVGANTTNNEMVRTYLAQWECPHEAASGGEEALRLLRQASASGEPFDLALLDMTMHDLSGEQLGRDIKADAEIKDTRLVMLASLGQQGNAARLEEIGFAGYLVKPVKPSLLFDCLLNLLSERVSETRNGSLGGHATCSPRASCRRKPDGARRVSCWPRTTSLTRRWR